MKKVFTFLIFIAVVVNFTSPAYAQKVYRWKLAETWPKNFPLIGESPKKFIETVDRLSEGRLKITTETREVHNRPFGILEMVRDGQYQIGHTASYYSKNLDQNTLFFTTLPFGLIATESYSWFYFGGGQELMEKALSKHGLLAFPGGNSGNQMGGWFAKEINSLEDMQGLRMRIPGLAGDVMKSLGVNTVNLPPDELYAALETGKIEAVEWIGPSMDLGMGFHRIASYYYTGWHEPGTEFHFLVNKKAYDSLPADLQYILQVAMRLAAYDTYIQFEHTSAENLEKMLNDFPNIQVRAFPPDVIQALSKETRRQLNQLAASDPLSKEIIESIDSYKKKARNWTRFSNQAYLNNSPL